MTLNGVMAVILRYFSEFAYLPGVLRKSSRSLSHLLMSSCSQCASEATEFGKMTRKKGHYASQSFKDTDFGSNRKLTNDFLLVINTNLPPILYRFRDIAFDRFKIAMIEYPFCVQQPPPTEGFPWDDLYKIFSGYQRMAKVLNGIETLRKIPTGWMQERYRQTDERLTGDSIGAYSERELTFAINDKIDLCSSSSKRTTRS